MMTLEQEDVMVKVGEAIGLASAGHREDARRLLSSIWDRIGPHGDALHRIAVAHSLADVADNTEAAVGWDLRALAAAHELTDARVARAGMDATVATLLPSLHLNLADGYCTLGDRVRAAHHRDVGLAALHAQPRDGAFEHMKAGFDRITERLARTEGRGSE